MQYTSLPFPSQIFRYHFATDTPNALGMSCWQSHRQCKQRSLYRGTPCETEIQAGGLAPGTQNESVTPGLSLRCNQMLVTKCRDPSREFKGRRVFHTLLKEKLKKRTWSENRTSNSNIHLILKCTLEDES